MCVFVCVVVCVSVCVTVLLCLCVWCVRVCSNSGSSGIAPAPQGLEVFLIERLAMPKGPGKGTGKGLASLPEVPSMDWWAHGAEDPRGTAWAPPRAYGDPEPTRTRTYRTLGHLKACNIQSFRWFEHKFLCWVHEVLTYHWGSVQGGRNAHTAHLWQQIFHTLELDRKAQGDLMLLAHEGEVGRSEANEILWDLLSRWALRPEYEDLSHKTTHLVSQARRRIERPPEEHWDRGRWRWNQYYEPRHPQWSPKAVPRNYTVLKGPGGVPLAPPQCWGTSMQ